MSFASVAGDLGSGIGAFLGPTLGSNTTTQTTVTDKPDSSSTMIIVAVVIVVLGVAAWLYTRKKTS